MRDHPLDCICVCDGSSLIRKTCDRLPGTACDLRFEPAIHDPDSSESDLFYASGVFVQKTAPEQNDCDINPADIVC